MLSKTSKYLLILHGHKVHLTLEVLTKAKANWIDMLTLPSYTSDGLQPLDVAIFKLFKVTFQKYKNSWCISKIDTKVQIENLT